MTQLADRTAAAPARRTRDRSGLLRLAVGVVLLLSVVVRLRSPTPLWLDEALSVDIARLPLSGLGAALKQDGAPPFYYLLLHGWMAVFGQGTGAVRSLSVVFSVASLPLAFLLGRRVRDERAGWTAVLLLGSSPFAVRYATETRMYSLVVLLVLLGALALLAAWDDPQPYRLFPVTAVAALLLLTHYWSLYLLLVVGTGLLWAAWRGPRRVAALRCAGALVASLLFFLPWLPTFLYQAAHTGTPWAPAPLPSSISTTLTTWFGGTSTFLASLLGLLVWGLLVVALVGHQTSEGLVLRRPVDLRVALLAGCAVATMVVGVVIGQATSAGFVPRYASVAFGPFLVAAACGASGLLPRTRVVVVTLAVVAGGYGSALFAITHDRTQAGVIAAALRPRLTTVDTVVYCPDQTGPAVARLLPASTDQVVYPTMQGPQLVDWVDYAQRNAAASPTDFATRLLAQHPGPVWLVASKGHLTFGKQCEQLAAALTSARGTPETVMEQKSSYREQDSLTRWDAA